MQVVNIIRRFSWTVGFLCLLVLTPLLSSRAYAVDTLCADGVTLALASSCDQDGHGGVASKQPCSSTTSNSAVGNCTPVPTGTVKTASPAATPDATDLTPQSPGGLDTSGGNCAGDCNSIINKDLQILVNTLTIGVGVVAAIMMVVGGLQYMLARDNPQAVQAAKTRIFNAVLALVSFVFIWAFLQWIIPGGKL